MLTDTFRDSVEEAVRELGEPVARGIFKFAKERHGITLDRLPSNIDRMDEALRSFIGLGGAFFVIKRCSVIWQKRLRVNVDFWLGSLAELFSKVGAEYRLRSRGLELLLSTDESGMGNQLTIAKDSRVL